MWKSVEKMREGKPKTARHFVGNPVVYEWKEVENDIAAIQDDRIMADGRPAHAWFCEIEMLRAHEPELEKRERELKEKFMVLRIAEWAFMQDALTGDVILRIKQLPLTLSRHPEAELLQHPEKYCEVIKKEKPNG